MNKTLDIKINNQAVTPAEALVAIAGSIAAAAREQPPKLLAMPQHILRPSLVRSTREGGWGALGGVARQDLVQNPVFDSDAYHAAYKAGEVVVVYCAGNAALRALSERIGRPAFKYGAHSTLDLKKRLDSLNRENYAGYVKEGDRFVCEPGWDKWEMQQIELVFPLHPRGPVSSGRRALRVALPSGYPFGRFDKDLHRAIAASSLIFFVNTTAGRSYLEAQGVAPEALKRWTAYEFSGPEDVRYSEATECYFTTPFVDMSRLAIIAERLILRHLDLEGATLLQKRPRA